MVSEQIRRNSAADHRFVVPAVHRQLGTSRVLTTDLVDGLEPAPGTLVPVGAGKTPLPSAPPTRDAVSIASRTPRIAILYATAAGSTRGVAEFLGAHLSARGAAVEVTSVTQAPELAHFDAVVLGSAVHNTDLLPTMHEYARTHRDALDSRPTWLFAVGLAPALRGPVGRWFAGQWAGKLASIGTSMGVEGSRTFAGRMDRDGVPLWVHLIYLAMGGGRYGDLRDWDDIRRWADTIADSLRLPSISVNPTHQ
ncbi:flavodoxin domain-containing protein [Nocardia otitidiscaviarum]|uniref:flavodoxin domain-containing protein n=1 Tax=Nocardia otitidiscaviarum TaxID=1823 RepID=UPI00226BD1CE|nr:flavodoxin domain-containing protein [Nocardia otitidiscaviarum]